jgi:DNA-binding Lrp family transcriptional regulator
MDTTSLDAIDRQLLDILQTEGRISNAALARRVSLSPPATHARVKRLEEQGYIRKFAALLNPEKLGYDMLCFVNITLQHHNSTQLESFRKEIQKMPEVLECHHVTGEYDYLLKVVIHNRKGLERFVVEKLTPMPGVSRIYTSLVLTEVKSSTAFPLNQ